MTARVVRAALIETVNAYGAMPTRRDDLAGLIGKLGDIRRANLDHHVALLSAAKAEGAQVVGLGELFAAPYFALDRDPLWRDLAEDAASGETISRMQEAARALELIIIAPIYEVDSSGKRFNTAVVIHESGELAGKYRKTHIPFGSNEQASFSETFYYERSDGACGGPSNISKNSYFPVFATSVGPVGVAICYDRHFEGAIWSLAKEGAKLIFSPAVTFGAKSQRMWRLEFQVDAARHNVFIGGSNRKGSEAPWNQAYFGDSHFVGPNGPLPNLSQHPNLVVSDVPLGELDQADPSGWNLPRDIRHAIYSPRG